MKSETSGLESFGEPTFLMQNSSRQLRHKFASNKFEKNKQSIQSGILQQSIEH